MTALPAKLFVYGKPGQEQFAGVVLHLGRRFLGPSQRDYLLPTGDTSAGEDFLVPNLGETKVPTRFFSGGGLKGNSGLEGNPPGRRNRASPRGKSLPE